MSDYAAYSEIGEEDLYYEQTERPTDIYLSPGMANVLLFLWLAISLVGLAVIFLSEMPVTGAVIIAAPSFIGMVMSPTFALCLLMLVLPTGAGVGYQEMFSLDRGVGLVVAVAFLLNLLLTRPRLGIHNKGLWVTMIYTVWILLASLGSSFVGPALIRAFTQVQLMALIFIVYWVIETNGEKTLRWILRSYLVGSLGAITLTFITGAAIRSIDESSQARYSATLGSAVNANFLAGLTVMAFLAAIYLFVRDKNIFWRLIYLVGILFLPIMLLRIGSRGALVALMFTMLSPLLFIRQVVRKPALVALLLVVVLLVSIAAAVFVTSSRLEEGVSERLTSIDYAKESLDYRFSLNREAIRIAMRKPSGMGYYDWLNKTSMRLFPHSDFFFLLGVYGFPAAGLFVLFVILMLRTIRRMPLTPEKLYARAVITYLFVVGMNNVYVFKKFYWVFMAIAMACEKISRSLAEQHEFSAYQEKEQLEACEKVLY